VASTAASALAGPRRSRIGLGLSIVRSVAAAHGGDVEAAPRSGGGLTVMLRLPTVGVSDGGSRVTPPSGGEATYSRHGAGSVCPARVATADDAGGGVEVK
jgi:hypothetical protein